MPQVRATPIVYQGQQPAANPFPKVIYGGIVNAFGNNIYGIRRASFVANAGTTDQAIIAPNGTCSSGLATPTSFILSFGTQQSTDSYGLTIPGGPGEPDPGNIFTQNVGPSSTTIITGFKTTKGKGGRKLPWMTDEQQGDGIICDPYGSFDRIMPDGTTYSAPGGTDPIVNIKRNRVKLATSGTDDISYLQFTGDADPIYKNKGVAVDITKLETKLKADGLGGGAGASYATGVMLNHTNTWTVTNSRTAIPWDKTYTDNTGGLMWSATQPTRLTAPVDGTYLINGWTQLSMPSTPSGIGEFEVDIALNGYEYIREDYGPVGTQESTDDIPQISVSALVPMKKGDYVELWAAQTTGLVCHLSVGEEAGVDTFDFPVDSPLFSGFCASYVGAAAGLGSLPHYTWSKSASHTSSGFSQISLILDPSTDAVSGFTSTDPTSGVLLFPAGTFVFEGDAALSGLPSNSVVQVSVAGLRNDPSDTNQNVVTSTSNIGGVVIPAPAPINRVVKFTHPWQPSVIVTATTLTNPATDTFSVTGFDLMVTQIGS